ncbi:MAG TPA: protein kinase, partial [Planctomycetota bacterium]|nr:protein kinase [Planctomycetota bacterium]
LFDERGEARVGDWGLVRDLGRSRLTETGGVLGTPAFMPPEQIEGRPVDRRADVFALGGILHYLVMGSRPFAGQTWSEIHENIRRDARERVVTIGAPAGLDAILDRALAWDEAKRTGRASDLARELDGLLAGARERGGVPRALLALPFAGVVVALAAFALVRGARPTAASAPQRSPVRTDFATLEAQVRRVLDGPAAPVASAQAPWEVVSTSPDLLRLAAGAAVVYDLTDVEKAAGGKTDASLAVLRGLALLGTGDAASRGEAARCLGDAHGQAREIAHAIQHVDAIVPVASDVIFDANTLEMKRDREELVRELRAVLAEPGSVARVVLGPLVASAREAAVTCAFLHHVDDQETAFLHLRAREDWARLLAASLESADGPTRDELDRRMPDLSGSLLLARESGSGAHAELARRSEDLARSLSDRDPALAASLAVLSIHERIRLFEPPVLERLEAARVEAKWIEGLLARAPGEVVLRETARHHLAVRLAELERDAGLASNAGQSAEGAALMELAARDFRDELDRVLEPLELYGIKGQLVDARRWMIERSIECLIVLSPRRPIDARKEGKIDLVPGHPLGALLLQAQGKPEEALAFLDEGSYAASSPWTPAWHEVRAVALADLGRDEDVRRELATISTLERGHEIFGTHAAFLAKLPERLRR